MYIVSRSLAIYQNSLLQIFQQKVLGVAEAVWVQRLLGGVCNSASSRAARFFHNSIFFSSMSVYLFPAKSAAVAIYGIQDSNILI